MRLSDYRKRLSVGRALDVLLVPVVAFLITLKLQEVFNVNWFLIGAALVYLSRNLLAARGPGARVALNELDYALMLVVAVEVLTYATSIYRPNSFYWLVEVLFFYLFYNLVRFNLVREYQRTSLYLFVSLWGVLLFFVALYYFLILRWQLGRLGFADITNFRNYIYALNPTGVSIGEWVTVLFLILPFAVIVLVRFRRSRVVRVLAGAAVLATSYTVALTFIRGAYAALAASFAVGTLLFYLYGVFPLRRLLLFDALMAGLLALCLLPLARPVMTTLSVLKTTSQVRSFEGRKNIWRDSLDLVGEHPLVGVGANNFAMQYVAYKEPGSDAAFALRPFNYFLQILVEKGALGLVAYGLLLLSFYRVAHRKIRLLGGDVYRVSVVVCYMTAYASLIVRDLSESSVLGNRGVNVLLWFIFADLARLEDSVGPNDDGEKL